MALSEFVALEAAYRALQPLDAAARGRALRWLTDALAVQDHLAESSESSTTSESSWSTAPNGTQIDGAAPRPESGVIGKEKAGNETTTVESPTVTDEAAAEAAGPGTIPTTEPAVSTARVGRKRAVPGAKGGKKGRGGKQPEKERVYRRMPPVSDVLAAYKKVGTVSGLAGYFDVPRHTVQGWARRLRSAGYEIGRKSEAGK
jgi:hypothetical protein